MAFRDKERTKAYRKEWNEKNKDRRREYNRIYQQEWSQKNREEED